MRGNSKNKQTGLEGFFVCLSHQSGLNSCLAGGSQPSQGRRKTERKRQRKEGHTSAKEATKNKPSRHGLFVSFVSPAGRGMKRAKQQEQKQRKQHEKHVYCLYSDSLMSDLWWPGAQNPCFDSPSKTIYFLLWLIRRFFDLGHLVARCPESMFRRRLENYIFSVTAYTAIVCFRASGGQGPRINALTRHRKLDVFRLIRRFFDFGPLARGPESVFGRALENYIFSVMAYRAIVRLHASGGHGPRIHVLTCLCKLHIFCDGLYGDSSISGLW